MEDKLTSIIRDSIKQKLIELEAFVDDELPDYIMVMVANKRTKECMNNELSLFLKENTVSFTNWLHDMLDTFQLEASAQLSKNNVVNSSEGKKTNSTSFNDDDILALDIQENDDDILSKELHGEVIKKYEPIKPVKEAVDDTLNSVVKKEIISLPQVPVIGGIKSTITTRKQALKCKSVIASLKRISEADDEYDPLNPSVKSTVNFVEIGEKKSSIPPSVQANKLLLFKAIDDANKSILGGQTFEEVYKPTPIKFLASSVRNLRKKTISDVYSKELLESNYDNVPSAKRFASTTPEDIPVFVAEPNCQYIDDDNSITLENIRTVKMSQNILESEDVIMDEDFTCAEVDHDSTNSSLISVHPHFVVTLDGINHSKFKEKWSSLQSSGNSPVLDSEISDDSWTEENVNELTVKNEKLPDKCRYWPICKHGDNCLYLHPKTQCKSFPNCNFGDKCHFIHPVCKFDSLCSRKDCPYTHKNKRDLTGGAVIIPPSFPKVISQVPYQNTVCKYFPKCSSYNCPYIHPKKCKFGSMCKSLSCPFTHPLFPSRNQLKWKAGSSF